MKKQRIVLVLGAMQQDVEFNLDIIKYNNFLNAGAGKNKTQAVNNFLVNCCETEHKPILQELLANEPGAANSILEVLLEEFAPDVAVVVKKSTTEQSDSEATV
ncbi:MAG: putative phage tail assembly chaperone [Cycloclasticus sp.]|jgi:Protein of unknown function (DUF2765).